MKNRYSIILIFLCCLLTCSNIIDGNYKTYFSYNSAAIITSLINDDLKTGTPVMEEVKYDRAIKENKYSFRLEIYFSYMSTCNIAFQLKDSLINIVLDECCGQRIDSLHISLYNTQQIRSDNSSIQTCEHSNKSIVFWTSLKSFKICYKIIAKI